MPMMSSDFPSAVSPRMASGGAMEAPGALNQASQLSHPMTAPLTRLMNDAQAAKQGIYSVISRLRQVPGIDIQAFDNGVSTMERGLAIIGETFKKAIGQ